MRPQRFRKCTALEHNLVVLTYTIGGWDLLCSFNKAGLLPSTPFIKGYERMPNPFEGDDSLPCCYSPCTVCIATYLRLLFTANG